MENKHLAANIAERISKVSQENPNKIALYYPHFNKKKKRYNYETLTFIELETKINKFSHQLFKLGLRKGDKTLLFLRPSLDFHAMVFALFKSGIVPVLIDPGMGRKNLLNCIKQIEPVGLIAEKEIHFIRYFFPKVFKSVRFSVTTGKLNFFKHLQISKKKKISIEEMKNEKFQNFSTTEIDPQELAALLFTSGGTGIPKGVEYSHHIFNTQTDVLKEMFQLSSEDIDLPGFPLFSLFTLAMGMSSIIPDMDPSKPAKCKPQNLFAHIQDLKPTFMAGSPAIWERVADYCFKEHKKLTSVRVLAMFGAPVSVNLHRKFKPLLPFGTTFTPYGATEALPVTNITGEYILKHTAKLTEDGKGTCIGLPAPGIEIRLVPITDNVIANFEGEYSAHTKINIPGEIIVRGNVVTKSYHGMSEKTAEAKIYDENSFWHRMGDVGFFDEDGKLWFLGRKSHVLKTKAGYLFPIPTEAIFNRHPDVLRSALIGIGPMNEMTPAIVIERKDGRYLLGREKNIFESELILLGKNYPHTKDISTFYYSSGFPVDVRHNIKIDRIKLRDEVLKHESKKLS